MLKTSEKNLVKQKKEYSSRPWKEWGIDLYQRYQADIYLSTRAKLIFFHTTSVIIIVLVTIGLLEYVQNLTLLDAIESLNTLTDTSSPTDKASDRMDAEINKAQLFVYTVVVLLSVFVAFIATHFALKPIRASLIVQKRFIASVAHELRTPLAILKTQNEVTRLEIDSTSPIAETLEQNVKEIDYLTEILNNLLLFNRVDTLESIRFDMVDLKIIIDIVIMQLKKLAEKKGVVITLEESVIPHVYGNATGLEQAIFNLVKNGINYTRRGGQVVIKCVSITDSEVTIRISDNGVGIEENELPHIFEPFYRTDGGQEVSTGTGLGLALVFEIIKLHNGKIKVESILGVGTQFDVFIPRQTQARMAHRPLEVGVAYDFSK